jgi:hypothetical protein
MPKPESTPTPTDSPKSSLDDLFGTPSASAPESTPAPTEPAKSGLDDLFGAPAPTTAEPVKPSPVDDLFGSPAPSATPPAASNAIDDLFGSPTPAAGESAPAPAKPADDLFNFNEASPVNSEEGSKGREVARPVSSEAPDSTPNFDDLFGTPGNAKVNPSQSAPSLEEKIKTGPEENNFDDLFKSTSLPSQPEFKGAEFRSWIDNTGSYEVKARLVMIYPDRVRLLKDNGKHTTVPFSRLCESDRDYVNWVAVSLTGSNVKFVATETGHDEAKEIAR